MATDSSNAVDGKRKRYLLLLLGALALFVGYRQIGGLFNGDGDGFLRGNRNADFASVLDTEVEALRLSHLDAQAQKIVVGRSPWEYGRRPIPPPIERPPKIRQPVQQVEVEAIDPSTLAPPKPVPPPVDVDFLGSFGTATRQVAVFSKGDVVINALVGDVVSEKFRVHAIGLESVDLTFEGFPDTPPQRLPLKQK